MQTSGSDQAILQEARNQGIQQGLVAVALNMVKEGMDVSQIARLTGLPEEQVKQLKSVKNVQLPQTDPLASFIGAVSHGSLTQQLDRELYDS
jgi:predicted transposase YdaD